MTDETVTIENLPNVRDINVLLNAIQEIGAKVDRIDAHTVKINGSFIRDFNVDNEYIRKIRASYYLIGALLGKYKRAEVALPGGCNIGSRPIDLHLKGFSALGANVDIKHGLVLASAEKLTGTHIYLDKVSVGATINIMMAASMAEEKQLLRTQQRATCGGCCELLKQHGCANPWCWYGCNPDCRCGKTPQDRVFYYPGSD